MACYHLRIKTDKKPDGMKVSATEHVEYLNRDGRYRDVDAREELRTGVRDFKNLITGEFPILGLPKHRMLLYSSPFGKIVLDQDGVRVNRHASPETAAIALSVAQKIFGDELTVCGHEKFCASCLSVERDLQLGLHFRDEKMEHQLEQMKEARKEIERRRSSQRGALGPSGCDGGSASGSRGEIQRRPDSHSPLNTQRGAEGLFFTDASQRTILALAKAGPRLPVLPARDMDAHRTRSRVPVPRAIRDQLLDSSRGSDAHLDLRWIFSARRREVIEKTAGQIMAILQKGVGGDFAFAHVQYIRREAAFAMRGGCMATGHHLPKWAKDSPLRFFHAADRYERANGERYKEIVFSLPNELTLAQNREILDAFLSRYMKNYYYAWAIHEKVGAMSDGERHPHVHLMFSTREIDDVERRAERTPEMFFHRANKKHPERGGCAKSRKWTGANRAQFLIDLRENFARIQNDVLEKYHIPVHVDHRSLAVQKMEAELRGDTVLVELLDRMPETSVSPTSIVRDDDVVRQQKELRKFQQHRLDKIIARELESDAQREKKAASAMRAAMQSYESIREDLLPFSLAEEDTNLGKLISEMENARRDAQAAEMAVLWGRQALEEAQLDFLGDEGREAWEWMTSAKCSLAQAKDFEQTLYDPLPDDASIDEEAARSELQLAMIERISKLEAQYDEAEKAFAPFHEVLERPGTHKHLQYRVNEYLFQGKPQKTRLEKRIDAFREAVQKVRSRMDALKNVQEDIPSDTMNHAEKMPQNVRPSGCENIAGHSAQIHPSKGTKGMRNPDVAALIAKDEEEEIDRNWNLIAEMEKDEMQTDR